MELIEIIEQNEEELKAALEAAFCNAVDHVNMEYTVEIYPDGEIRTLEHSAGSSFQSYDSWKGKSFVVHTFCFEHLEPEISEEDFRRHMTEEEQQEVEQIAEDNGISFLSALEGGYKNFCRIYDETAEEWKDWYKDEYAMSAAEEVINRICETL